MIKLTRYLSCGLAMALGLCLAYPNAAQAESKRPPKSMVLTLNIEFESGKATLRSEFNDEINKVAYFMQSYPKTRMQIEGHTDNVGSAQANLELSQRRAEAVMKYLIDVFGISSSRLIAKGYGATRPIADNESPEGQKKNRRVIARFPPPEE